MCIISPFTLIPKYLGKLEPKSGALEFSLHLSQSSLVSCIITNDALFQMAPGSRFTAGSLYIYIYTNVERRHKNASLTLHLEKIIIIKSSLLSTIGMMWSSIYKWRFNRTPSMSHAWIHIMYA